LDNELIIQILLTENQSLKERIVFLEERLKKLENPKNSKNSSIPPSKDENRPLKTNSLREKTGRKPGGQEGHKGSTLQMTSDPDLIEEHHPEYCSCCGKSLEGIESEFVEKRQIVDIPEIVVLTTEHLIFRKRCECGHENISEFDKGKKNRRIYGPNIESLTAYFSVRQYTPFKRLQEIFRDVFKSAISEGGLHEMMKRISIKALPIYEQIREQISNSRYAGTDETGGKINGKKIWFWTWQNDNQTFITSSDNRGTATIDENFKDGFKNTILGHDCWKSHFQVEALTHQICTAHLLRELEYLNQLYQNQWSKEFEQMLKFALNQKRQLNPEDYYSSQPKTVLLERWLDELLEKYIDEDQKELVVFKNRMQKYRQYLFTFLYNPEVPPDNNGSERAVRNIKVKLKVSGQFKSKHGSDKFAILRSITDTALKNGQNVLKTLSQVADSSMC
jgi:transposase